MIICIDSVPSVMPPLMTLIDFTFLSFVERIVTSASTLWKMTAGCKIIAPLQL